MREAAAAEEVLAAAVDRAVDVRGTVMLQVRGDATRWCAACAAVNGPLELRVGEPPGGWLRRRGAAAGERWLEAHGFRHRVDAWTLPDEHDREVPAADPAAVAGELLGELGRDPAAPLLLSLMPPA